MAYQMTIVYSEKCYQSDDERVADFVYPPEVRHFKTDKGKNDGSLYWRNSRIDLCRISRGIVLRNLFSDLWLLLTWEQIRDVVNNYMVQRKTP